MKKGQKKPSQTYMFGLEMPEADTNPFVLKMPSEAQLKYAESMLNASTKAELLEIASIFTKLIKEHSSVKLQKDTGKALPATELAPLLKSNSPKADIMHALAIMIGTPENLRLYVDSLSEEMHALWRLMLARLYLTFGEVHRVLNISGKLHSAEGYSRYYYGVKPTWNHKELSWFAVVKRKGKEKESWGDYHKDSFYVTISPAIHRLFFPVFYPDAMADHSLEELPEGMFRIVTGEKEAVRGYAVVAAMLASDALQLSSGRYLVAGQKVAQKRLNMQDFDIGETSGLRAALYVQMLTLNYISLSVRQRTKPSSFEDAVRNIVQSIGSHYHYLPLFIFAHIKGLTRTVTENHLCCDLAVHVLRLLATHPHNWVPIRDFYMHSFSGVGSTHDTPFPPLVFATLRDDNRTDLTNTFTGQYLTVDDYTRHFGNTFFKGLLYTFAALGMVELACTPTPQSPISPYAAIAYARLTALGQYALGLSPQYTMPEVAEETLFELDEGRLIVRNLCGADNPYLSILQEVARHIGAERYEVSAQTFLAACSQRDDVEVRIQNFKQFISPNPPAVWTAFFQQLLTHCHPLTLSHQSFHIYTIPHDDRELQRLIVTDPQLRNLVIRAEGYRILVSDIHLSKFKTRLKALGYLL